MRRAFFFIVALLSATSSFASLPRASTLDRASEHAPAAADPLPETRVWASDVLAPFERPPESELTRALHQAYADLSTTNASGLGRFLSVDPVLDVKRALRSPQMWNRYSYVVNNPLNRIDPDGRLVQLVGTDDERKKALELIKANLREQDRKYVTMNKNGVLSVDSKAKGGLGLSMLRDLTKHKATVNVSLGLTATAKAAPGPSRTSVIDLQAAAGGGVTLRPWQATSGTFEVHVDPRGNLQFGVSPGLVMGHELLGHAWDLMFKGTSSERSAVTTETNLLFQLGLPQFRPVPTDEERP